jgi:hypothetical protein
MLAVTVSLLLLLLGICTAVCIPLRLTQPLLEVACCCSIPCCLPPLYTFIPTAVCI